MIAYFLVGSLAGCAATQEFFGMTPSECEARADDLVNRVEKATARACEAQQEWKGDAAVIEQAIKNTQ